MAGPIDNPYGGLKAYPKVDPLEIDDPFEGKKLENIDEPEWGKKKAKGSGKGMAGKSPPPNARLEKLTRPVRQFAGDVAGLTKGVGGEIFQNMGKAGRALVPVGKFASRASVPAGVTLAAHDIHRGVTDPNFMTGLIDMLGGEEVAYNIWVAQEAEEGRERPSYEDYRAHAEEMIQAGELEADAVEYAPDAREVAKRALKVRE
jgi:hypothetical protein|tara:strand:+ start:161 stop:769 length:609 start_codon:yes stop_codon:yes gene_type:complete